MLALVIKIALFTPESIVRYADNLKIDILKKDSYFGIRFMCEKKISTSLVQSTVIQISVSIKINGILMVQQPT